MRLLASIGALLICLGSGAASAQQRSTQLVSTALLEDGQPVALEWVEFKPPGEGPFPTLVFNHGSVGNGNDPREVAHTATYPELAGFFNERGWMVVFPQRRGRGKSGGRYAEGWAPELGRYACDPALSLAGLEHAMQDLGEVAAQLRTRADMAQSRVLICGHSKAGILAMAFAARHPDGFVGVVNFVGGWVGERCETAPQLNTETFVRAARFPGPTLWLYGERDPYYGIGHSRASFDAFRAAGGQGSFQVFTLGPLRNDHQIVRTRAVWQDSMAVFLDALK